MKKERIEDASKILRNKNNPFFIIGVHTDPQLKETTSLTCGELDPNSHEAKDLMREGFKLIYPAELSTEAVEQSSRLYPDVFPYGYQHHINNPLIVDNNAQPTLDFAREIISHYLSAETLGPYYVGSMYGFDKANNSISQYIDPTHFKPDTLKKLTTMLQEFGFTTSLDELGNLNVHSDIPYPTVPKSKFQGIFDKAKGKLKNTFDKLKESIFKGKDTKEKDTQGPEL